MSNSYRSKSHVNLLFTSYQDELNVKFISIEDRQDKISTENYTFSNYTKLIGDPIHVAMDIQGERVRLWLDKEQIFDLPGAFSLATALNQLRFEMEQSSYSEGEVSYFISNIRIAEGRIDKRSKLLVDGRLVSSKIFFDTNSSRLTSDIDGVIDEVGLLMHQDSTIRIRIIGHTDSDGVPSKNLMLSKDRAEVVKKEIIKRYLISGDRIQTVGRGDLDLITRVDSEKAKNRRVEFVKM